MISFFVEDIGELKGGICVTCVYLSMGLFRYLLNKKRPEWVNLQIGRALTFGLSGD
jgi:hypothetical protein